MQNRRLNPLKWPEYSGEKHGNRLEIQWNLFGHRCVLHVEVCSKCGCASQEWLGSQSLSSCAAACYLKSSHVQHSSGTRFDGDPGACPKLKVSRWRTREDERSLTYFNIVYIIDYNSLTMLSQWISLCFRSWMPKGDQNCGCCTSLSPSSGDAGWGINVYGAARFSQAYVTVCHPATIHLRL